MKSTNSDLKKSIRFKPVSEQAKNRLERPVISRPFPNPSNGSHFNTRDISNEASLSVSGYYEKTARHRFERRFEAVLYSLQASRVQWLFESEMVYLLSTPDVNACFMLHCSLSSGSARRASNSAAVLGAGVVPKKRVYTPRGSMGSLIVSGTSRATCVSSGTHCSTVSVARG